MLLGLHWSDVWRVGNLILAAVAVGWAMHLLHLTFITKVGRPHRVPSGLRWSLVALTVHTALLAYLLNARLGEPVTWRTPASSAALVATFIALTGFRPADLITRRLPTDVGGDAA